MEEYSNSWYGLTENPLIPSKEDVYISSCLFYKFKCRSRGGAVSCTSSAVQRIFIEETTFTTCKITYEYGGGIFFSNTINGECVIFHTCAFDCSSTCSSTYYSTCLDSFETYGQFAYIKTKEDASSKNEVNESTITGTKNEGAWPRCALYLYNSNIICSSVNISNNECVYYTAIGCSPTINPNACTCLIIYTTIVKNNAECGCVSLWQLGSTQLVSTCNIINNNQSSNLDGIICARGNIFISESCIIANNKGERVFYRYEYDSSSQITITNCTLDSNFLKYSRYEGTLTIIGSKKYSFINALSHIVTANCEGLKYSSGLRVEFRNVPKKQEKQMKKYKSCICRKRNVEIFLNRKNIF